ncbi:hypothetical protein M9H77_10941 [Catharanthus roseus]|uniref:Uncharacterized protein n=1 Tax=Catharanthus roseus TaxID=4058 RepID=A0ACC0BD68_CATRO|nr:hypothetical protein M9H77_10941 [Catharanthus roseus]
MKISKTQILRVSWTPARLGSRLGREPNELGEFGFSVRDEEQPRSALSVKNNVNPSVNRWPQETALNLSLSKAPFFYPAATRTVTQRLTGTNQRRTSPEGHLAGRVEPGPPGIKGLPAQLPLLMRPTWMYSSLGFK